MSDQLEAAKTFLRIQLTCLSHERLVETALSYVDEGERWRQQSSRWCTTAVIVISVLIFHLAWHLWYGV